ncbi:YrrS family protein [Bacillus carboniphilus]|uniref:YrrS family protein n=1 Tax=Bacillus carboniphilus TaxID=86663 RepID=A0ABY9JZQ4_9BACI|nr:YrrS family protein [Bacillus carboniphilus]WLR44027.1 YrrS family protein [Bacillus carboniphilus]
MKESPSRFETRNEKRKKNLVLYILIGIVWVLILVIGVSLLPEKEDSSTTSEETKKENTSAENKSNVVQDTEENEETSAEEETTVTAEPIEEEVEDPFAEATVEQSSEQNIEKVITNSSWKPIGTTQEGEHVAQYDTASVDWSEMEQSLSYAIGVPVENMTTWYIGNNGSPQDAIGTVSPSDRPDETYQVEIRWIDEKGWKPVVIKKLTNNPYKR